VVNNKLSSRKKGLENFGQVNGLKSHSEQAGQRGRGAEGQSGRAEAKRGRDHLVEPQS
jgi:hypothetical protein